MSTTTVTAGQSLVDVAIQELGSLDALFDLAAANGLAITGALSAGQVLEVPASALARVAVAGYFAGRVLRVNTANDPAPTGAAPPDGIFDGTYADQFN